MSGPAKGKGHGGPARGAGHGGDARGKWADAEPGNVLALRHGARSPRKIGALAQELAAGLLADRPDLACYPEAVDAWARSEARAMLVESWIADNGLTDDEGRPHGLLKYASSFERNAADARQRLGLDPRAEAELTRERSEAIRSTVDLEAIRARGIAAIAGRRAALEAAETAPAVPGGSTDRKSTP